MTKIPVVLVTGFLGSGKTTLLRHLATSHPDWRMVFLVNEFAETDVDGGLLAETGRPTHSVIGGSLFCECKAGDFIRTMRERVTKYHHESPLDAVIIETSGMADPEAIGSLFDQHGLSADFSLRRIVTVVAPGNFLRLQANLPVVEKQILTSDLILINKTDTVEQETLSAVEKAVRQLNPSAEIVHATYCQTDLSLPERLTNIPQGQLSTCEANPFSTIELSWPSHRSVEELRTLLQSLPGTILRIKGCAETPSGCWRVERTVDTFDLQPQAVGISSATTLVFIAHDDHEADLLELQKRWEAL
jgi:G3E family GTPase